jgi:hypothetical protein
MYSTVCLLTTAILYVKTQHNKEREREEAAQQIAMLCTNTVSAILGCTYIALTPSTAVHTEVWRH